MFIRKPLIIIYVLINLTITPFILQAEEGTITYNLDQPTVERGYPVKSADGKFSLLVSPGIFKNPISVEVSPYYLNVEENGIFKSAYQFTITQDGQVPLLKRALTLVFDLTGQEDVKYKRLYYYYPAGGVWLALSVRLDKERNLILSDKVDFTEGIIGLFVSPVLLPDRIELANASFSDFELVGEASNLDLAGAVSLKASSGGSVASGADQHLFTLTLGTDIVIKGYTIDNQGAKLAVRPEVLDTPSVVTVNFNQGILDYNFTPLDKGQTVLARGKNLVIVLPVPEFNYRDQVIVFWDNNRPGWRELPSTYNYLTQTVRALSPFPFGKYKVQDKAGVLFGQATWFRDSLITKTTWAAASNDYDYGARVRVTNLNSGKQVEVEVLSVGPFVAGRVIDLSHSAFAQIADPKMGVAEVRVEAIQAAGIPG